MSDWADAESWPEAEDALRRSSQALADSTLAENVEVMRYRYPDDVHLDELAQMLTEIADVGLDGATERRRRAFATESLVHAWLDVGTRHEAIEFLRENEPELRAPDSVAALDAIESPVARRNKSILELRAAGVDLDTVLDIVIDPAVADERAVAALERGDRDQFLAVLAACPAVLDLPARGIPLRTAALLLQGREEQAVTLARDASGAFSVVQRRAFLIRLRKLEAGPTALPRGIESLHAVMRAIDESRSPALPPEQPAREPSSRRGGRTVV